jgi:hypothetical protein
MGQQAAQPERERAWDGVVRREIDVELRAINEDERSFEVVASTETLDSHGDVLRQFWDLSRYEKNGVVLWNHNLALYMGADAEDTLPIGRGEARVEGKKLVAKIWLLKGEASEEPLVDKIWRRVKQLVLKAVSVGFRPGQVTRKVNAAGETEFYELGSKDRPNELREISLVPMGSNPDAVAKSIAWERKHLSREAAPQAAEGGSPKEKHHMDPELQKALEAKAVAEQKLLDTTTRASEATERAKKLETDLTAEKAISTKLSSDLDAARAELKTTKNSNATIVLDGLQGVKFAPAEREELDKLVADVGLDRVKSLLEKRGDLALTQPVLVDGKPVGTIKTAPEPVAGSGDASGDLVAEATKGL